MIYVTVDNSITGCTALVKKNYTFAFGRVLIYSQFYSWKSISPIKYSTDTHARIGEVNKILEENPCTQYYAFRHEPIRTDLCLQQLKIDGHETKQKKTYKRLIPVLRPNASTVWAKEEKSVRSRNLNKWCNKTHFNLNKCTSAIDCSDRS